MTNPTTPVVWIDGHPQLEAIAAAVYERCTTGDGGIVHDDPRNIAVAALSAVSRELAAFAEYENTITWMTTCTSCARVLDSCIRETERAERAQQEVRRLGLMVDEYGAGASALTDKLKRVRDQHRETCIAAKGQVPPTAFTCGLCEVLDAPAAAVLPASVDRAAVLREEAARIRAHCPDHLDAASAEGSWMDCHCAVADDMERRAADETPGEAKPWLSDSARIGRALIWSWTDIGKGAFGEGYRAAQAEARALLGGQRGTDVTPPVVGAQQPKEEA